MFIALMRPVAVADGDEIAGLHRFVGEQDHAADEVGDDLLQAETDADADRAGEDRKRGQVDADRADARPPRTPSADRGPS